MRAQDYYQAGSLKEAIAAAVDDVKQHPADTARRGFLTELYCFAGDTERADKQLDLLAHQNPDLELGLSLFRHLLRAAEARQQFYADGRLPEFLTQPPPHIRHHLEASIRIREGNLAEAAQLLAQAEAERPKPSGTANGKPFDDFRDLDDLTAPVFEVLTSNGKYYWVPVESVELMEFRPPQRPRDLVWQRVRMIVRDGPDGEVYLPALYAGSQAESEADVVRLGRATEWRGGEGTPVRGVGQRTFLVGDDAVPALELKEVTFNRLG